MTTLALIRHGPTAWNRAGRLQGRADVPLARAAGRRLRGLRLPDCLSGTRWLTSPLGRAIATARYLGEPSVEIDDRLIEMDWGACEGQTLAELRHTHGAALANEEARGLDLQPPGGESPRDVQNRLAPLLGELAAAGVPTVAVTHKGVIRAVLGLAYGWDFLGKPPVKLDWEAVHVFEIGEDGRPRGVALNLPLRACGSEHR